MTPVLAPTRLPTKQPASRNPHPATLNSANTYTQRISSTKPSCETRKHSLADPRRPVTCRNSTGERRGGVLVDQRAVANPKLSKTLSCGNTMKWS